MEFIFEVIDWIGEAFKAFIGGFARLFLASLLLWMVSLVFLLFRELFRPGDLNFKEYFKDVWKFFKLSFEVVAYGALVIAPILIFRSDDTMTYGMVWVASMILSFVFLYIRKQARGAKRKENSFRYHRFK